MSCCEIVVIRDFLLHFQLKRSKANDQWCYLGRKDRYVTNVMIFGQKDRHAINSMIFGQKDQYATMGVKFLSQLFSQNSFTILLKSFKI